MEITVMKKANKTKRTLWGRKEQDLLTIMIEDGKNAKQISGYLGRTEGAVRAKMCELGLYTKTGKSKPKRARTEFKTIETSHSQKPVTAPINQAQVGLMFSTIDRIGTDIDRIRGDVSKHHHQLTRIMDNTKHKQDNYYDEQLQELTGISENIKDWVVVSACFNAITLGVLAWTILN